MVSDNYRVLYSENDKIRRNGVALILRQDVAQAVSDYNVSSNQIISKGLCGKSINVTIIKVYTPAKDADEDEIESFYESIKEVFDHQKKT